MNIRELDVQYVTTATGEKNGVLIGIDDFEELLEDLRDLAVIAERRDEPTLSHEQVLSELRDNGLLN